SVDQFFFPDKLNGESTCRKQIDVMLNSMNEKELTVMKHTAEGLQRARETEDA
ncbi:MAG TPA: XRE family transcriptional regulator, partial [Candidatus Flavonifractor merdigallinarum]|nr:XRE family transcriptional regulator [Candidatus Flavonifractor merdigallinarum]